jgi:hypothetical protein
MAPELLKRAWPEVKKLPPAEEDALADRLPRALDEHDESEWDAFLTATEPQPFLDR